jgi:hypothetical protein
VAGDDDGSEASLFEREERETETDMIVCRCADYIQTSLDKCPTRLRDNKDFFFSI